MNAKIIAACAAFTATVSLAEPFKEEKIFEMPARKGQTLLLTGDENLGINVLDAARNPWKAQRILPRNDKALETGARLLADRDLFTLEYGAPVAPFAFTVPKEGTNFLWGAAHDVPNGAKALRWGKGWGKNGGDHIRFVMDVAQTGGPVEWQLLKCGRASKRTLAKFTTQPGETAVDREVGMVRIDQFSDGGIQLVAKGAGAAVRVSRLLIAPREIPVTYRRTFVLGSKPWRAGFSFLYTAGHVVRLNGKTVAEGPQEAQGGPRWLDLTGGPFAVGTNVVELSFNADSGYDRQRFGIGEFWTVEDDGTFTFLPTDERWEARVGENPWGPVRAWGRHGFYKLHNGKQIAEGSVPLHAGQLQVKPHGTLWPVFDEGKVAWDVELPPALKGATVAKRIENRRTGAQTDSFDGLKTGAYLIRWTLAKDGKTLDTVETEMIVTGPLPKDEVAYADFEKTLRSRMKLVEEIDCTAEPKPDTFVDHSGIFSGQKANVGKVGASQGFRYRETGRSSFDLFVYKIRVGTLGAPHILEVDIPDIFEQETYVSVNETYPIPFCNNGGEGVRGWVTGTGSLVTGGIMPYTHKMKTLRVVFCPGSRNITALVENGLTGRPAIASAMRVYEVTGGLPGLAIPKTDRVFMNHNERPLFMNWGAHVNPAIRDVGREYRLDFWYAAYEAIVNRIRYLKFAGHNAAIEGVYMYRTEFKTDSGESLTRHPEFDLLVPTFMMYRANGIRAFAGWEYTASPILVEQGLWDASDRDVAAGADTCSMVDRDGRQSIVHGACNFLHPAVERSVKNLAKEIYGRYAPLGVEGVVMQSESCGWQPIFSRTVWHQPEIECGYDDATVGRFARETGIALGLEPRDPERFAKRYAKLTSAEMLPRWTAWRAEKKRACFELVANAFRQGPWKWRCLAIPNVTSDGTGVDPSFYDLAASAATRDAALGRTFERYGITCALYPPRGSAVELVPKLDFLRNQTIPGYGSIFSASARQLVADYDAVYLSPIGLNEHNHSDLRAAKRAWWFSYTVNVFNTKPAGAFAYYDCTGICRTHTPTTIIHTWHDVNQTTGDADESRRFLAGFYASPIGEYRVAPNVSGITAKICGDALQLVNDTPYAVTDGTRTVGPFGLEVVRPVASDVRAAFRFVADEDAAAVARDAELVLKTPILRKRIGEDLVKTLEAANTPYDRCVILRSFEFMKALKDYGEAQKAIANQTRFAKILAEKGAVRVDFGRTTDLTDEKGVHWLCDQRYYGFAAYGGERLRQIDRGKIDIKGTDAPGVYRSEVTTEGGSGRYHLPVPEGTYEVRVHYADCFQREPGHWHTIAIGDDTRRYCPFQEHGYCGAGVHVFGNVRPVNGEIILEISKGVANGIEVYRK